MPKELNQSWRDYETGWIAASKETIRIISERQKDCSEELYWSGLEEAKQICLFQIKN